MQHHAKSGLFLIEMIISIAFFSVASAACINLFVSAHLQSVATRESNMAVMTAQSAAESFKSANAVPEDIAEILGVTVDDDNIVKVFYDSNWSKVDYKSKYMVEMKIDSTVVPASAVIEVFESDKSIHSIEVKKYVS